MASGGFSHHFKRIHKQAVQHQKRAAQSLHATHKHAKRLLKRHGVLLEKIRHHSVRSVTVAGVSAGVLAAPVIGTVSPQQAFAEHIANPLSRELILNPQQVQYPQAVQTAEPDGPSSSLASIAGLLPQKIAAIAPNGGSSLTTAQEGEFSLLLQQSYHLNATAELDGIRLNTSYGLIAGEQHLPLYPGDTLANHTSDPTANLTGMVPGLPSWGYFASNRASVTQQEVNQERYYIAVQTFLSPGWSQNYQQMYEWFKYRKMIVVNPENGSAVVTDIADAGPSPFTGRTFGASNETLIGLGLGAQRIGNVYVFFVDDPTNTIPLGPLGGS